MKLTGRWVTLVCATTFITSGCVYSTIENTDFPQTSNAKLEKQDRQGTSEPSRYHDQSIRLWQDRPEYVALVDQTPVKRLRIVSAVAPDYPPGLRWGHVNGRVVVNFIVAADGRVEDARVIESSDMRFNDSAVAAVRKFTFLPALGANGPISSMETVPFDFWWSRRAHRKGTAQPSAR